MAKSSSKRDSTSGESAGQPLRVGLTGGIASGKSTIATMFAELGVPVIDTDIVAREVVEPGQPALAEISSHFGAAVVGDNGQLDRAALRKIVFADPAKRRKLEAILHPRIRRETIRQAGTRGGAYQLIVVPLLVESPLQGSMDRILVVDVPEYVQLQRLQARDAESVQQAQAMIAAQASRRERLAIADDVIRNDRDLVHARRQVAQLHQNYLRLAKDATR